MSHSRSSTLQLVASSLSMVLTVAGATFLVARFAVQPPNATVEWNFGYLLFFYLLFGWPVAVVGVIVVTNILGRFVRPPVTPRARVIEATVCAFAGATVLSIASAELLPSTGALGAATGLVGFAVHRLLRPRFDERVALSQTSTAAQPD